MLESSVQSDCRADKLTYSDSDSSVSHSKIFKTCKDYKTKEIQQADKIQNPSPKAKPHKTPPFHITHIEPYPALLHSLLKQSDIDSPYTHILPNRLQEIDMRIFEELEANDILFIDSTHIAKINSDVNRIFFEILPSLKSGVYIHFHDIFYPFSYPNDWLRDKNSWNEAYFLRAFLSFNTAFEIVFFNTCLNHLYADEFAAALPLSQKNTGGSIWLRKL